MKTAAAERAARDAQRIMESLGQLPRPVDKPVFIALSGLPGTGKSFFARKLAERFPLVILESDILRRLLFPQPTYAWWESARLFRAIHLVIEELLRKGIPLILDATNLNERYRKTLYSIAGRVGVKFILVKLTAPLWLVRERLEARMKDPLSRSEADWEVYRMMKEKANSIRRQHHTVDSSRNISPAIEKILHEIQE